MRDLIAGLLAIALLLVAASLATTLQIYRRRRQRARESERALGRTVVAEIPSGDDLVLFTEDDKRFYYGELSIDKDLIGAVRLLINGIPIASYVSSRYPTTSRARGPQSPVGDLPAGHDTLADQPEGIARDRWDVTIEAINSATTVECGAIRERVSQELARAVFDAVKRALERLDGPMRSSAEGSADSRSPGTNPPDH